MSDKIIEIHNFKRDDENDKLILSFQIRNISKGNIKLTGLQLKDDYNERIPPGHNINNCFDFEPLEDYKNIILKPNEKSRTLKFEVIYKRKSLTIKNINKESKDYDQNRTIPHNKTPLKLIYKMDAEINKDNMGNNLYLELSNKDIEGFLPNTHRLKGKI